MYSLLLPYRSFPQGRKELLNLRQIRAVKVEADRAEVDAQPRRGILHLRYEDLGRGQCPGHYEVFRLHTRVNNFQNHGFTDCRDTECI